MENKEDRLKRMQFLGRRNTKRLRTPGYIEKIQLITGFLYTEADFTDLEKYDIYQNKAKSDLQECFSGNRLCIDVKIPLPSDKVQILINFIILEIGDEKIFFSTDESYYCGLFEIMVRNILKNLDKILEYYPDTLMLISKDLECGVFIDLYDDFLDYPLDTSRTQFLQIVVWGDRWTKKLKKYY